MGCAGGGLGLDAVLALQFPSDITLPGGSFPPDDRTFVLFPLQFFRIGYFVGEHTEIEARTSLLHASVGDVQATQFTVEVAYGYHFGPVGRPQFFVGLGGGIDVFSEENHPYAQELLVLQVPPPSAVRIGVGVGAGAKVPIRPHLSVRFEGNYSYDFEREEDFLPAQHNVAVRVGLSYFTK